MLKKCQSGTLLECGYFSHFRVGVGRKVKMSGANSNHPMYWQADNWYCSNIFDNRYCSNIVIV